MQQGKNAQHKRDDYTRDHRQPVKWTVFNRSNETLRSALSWLLQGLDPSFHAELFCQPVDRFLERTSRRDHCVQGK